jgi:hypothetical protein
VTQQLLARGEADTPSGHAIRMVAFGDQAETEPRAAGTMVVPMRHVVRFRQKYLRDHWSVVRHAPIRDPAFAVLALIEKWGVQSDSRPAIKERPARRNDGTVRMRRRS